MRHPYEDEFDGMDWQSQRDRDEWRARREGYSGRPGYTGGYARDYAYGQSRPAGPGPGYFAGPRYGEHDRGRFGRGPMIVGDARRPTEDETFAERLGDFGYKVAHDIKAIFRGPKGYKRGDERIREDVCDRLNHVAQHAQADLGDVEISVKDGEVTVAGLVAHRRIKRMVEDVIEGVVGVVDIHNQLRVKPAEQHPSDHANAGASAGTPSDNGTRRPLERSPQTSGRPAP